MTNQNEKMTPMQKVDVLRAACCVAGIDGEIGAGEAKLINRIAREVGVGKASLEAMVQRASNDPDFHQQQFRILKSDPQHCMSVVMEVALADGEISDLESSVLQSLSENLQVPPDVFDQLIAKARSL